MSVHVLDNAPVVPGGGNQPVIPVSNLQQPEEIVVLRNVQPISSPSGGGDSLWEKINTYLRPIDTSNKVIIGNANSFVGGEILRVAGNIYSTNITVGTRYYLNGTTEYISQSAGELYFNSSIAGTHSLSDLAASIVTSQDILNWNEAFSWGNHALAGYLTSEVDPIFTASAAYGITGTNITNWNTAYTNNHTHTNKTLLDSLISSGTGTNFLGDDGTYHLINTTVAGSDTQIQFNNGGAFGANAAFTVTTASGTLNTTNLSVTDVIYIGGLTTYIDDISGDLTFTDSNAGSVTLSALLAGATNFWTSTTDGIYYGTGTDKVGINTTLPNESLTVVGNIEATQFNSKYYRYNGNWLIGTNVGGSSLLRTNVIAFDNTDTATPLTLMDLSTRQIEFDGDVLISSTKNLTVGNTTSTQYLQFNTSPSVPGVHTEGLVYWDSALGGLNIMSGVDGCVAQIPFENWVRVYNNTGSTLISGTAVYVTSASGDVVYVAPAQANSESTSLVTIGLVTHDIPAGTSGNVTISGIVHDINTASLTEGGYVYLSPTVAGGLTSTRPVAPNTVAAIGICTVRDASVGSVFVNLRVQPTVERLSNVYITGVSDDDVLSWDTATSRWTNRPVSGTPPSDGILDWDVTANRYQPYSTQQASLSFDTSSTTPVLTTRLNLNGDFYANSLHSIGNANIAVRGFTTSGSAISGSSGSGRAGIFLHSLAGVAVSNPVVTIQKIQSGTSNVTESLLELIDNPTTSGTISGALITGTVVTTERLRFDPRVVDGASAVASFEDTHNALTTTGAKLKSFRNQGSEKAYVDKDGGIGAGTDIYLPSTGKVYLGSPTVDGSWRIIINGTGLEFQRRESSSWVMKQTIEA